MELIQKAVADTPAPYYRTLHDDLTAALAEFAALGKALDTKAGQAAPPASAIRTALENVLAAVNDVAKAKLAVTMTKPAEEKKDDGPGEPGSNGKPKEEEGGERLPVIHDREDALNAILQLSDYFRKIEPHSPVPFALEQAVRWARMTLPDLMAELIPEDGPRKALFKQIGIRAPEGAGKDEKKK